MVQCATYTRNLKNPAHIQYTENELDSELGIILGLVIVKQKI